MIEPPLFSKWLLKSVLHWTDYDSVLGDLEETFQYKADRFGQAEANSWYRNQVIRSVIPFAGRSLYWGIVMLKNYLKIAFRNLRRHLGTTMINISSLTIGLACFILICLFVQHEFSYDTFHEKSDRIYRVVEQDPTGFYLGTNKYTETPAPLLNALLDEFPEVEHATQFLKIQALLRSEEEGFYQDGIYATEQFFDVFTFPLVWGNPQTVLSEPNSIVLTESMAQKLFGAMNPIGQTVSILPSAPWWMTPLPTERTMQVVGVTKDVPANSHISFDYLISMASSEEYAEDLTAWDNSNYFTYASLHAGFSLENFEAKLAGLGNKHLGQNSFYQDNPEAITTHLPQALTSIHLRSQVNGEFGNNGDIQYVYLFTLIAFLILLVASINYVNLTTARSSARIKEVGVRKSMGARRSQLVAQFMGEAIVPTIVAMIGALVLVLLLLPSFNMLTGRHMALDLSQNGGFLVMLILFGIGLGILSGSYPALSFSGLHPVAMIKGRALRNTNKSKLKRSLVIVQFSIGIALIIGTLIIWQQLGYIERAQTGLDRSQIISLEIKDGHLRNNFTRLEQSLLSHPGILEITASHHNPVYIDAQSTTRSWEGVEEGQSVAVYHSSVQQNYADVFDIALVEGGDLVETIHTDENNDMLINETFKHHLGWDTAVGKWIELNGRRGRVVGVVEDFNFQSFHQPVSPLALYLDSGDYSRLFVKVAEDDLQGSLSFIEQQMADLSPAFPFEYEFLDRVYNRMYESENNVGNIFSYFTILALAIACLGLFGLAAFLSSKRTKEVGLRKVLGASTGQILLTLSKEYVQLVGVAFVLSAPLAYVAMHYWLQEFAYRIAIGWDTFMLAGGIALCLALLSVGYQTIKTALTNPVNSLRYE